MTTIADIQNKLANKVFGNSNLTQNVEIQTYTETTNNYGEIETSFDSQVVVQGVVLDYTKFNKRYDEVGQYNNASFILLVPHSTSVDENSEIVFNSTTFIVRGIESIPYGSGFTHLIVFVSEKL